MTDHDTAVLAENEAHEQKVVEERDGFGFYLTVTTGIEVTMLVNIGRDAEARGDEPDLHWHRKPDGTIGGIIVAGRLSNETQHAPELVRPMGATPL